MGTQGVGTVDVPVVPMGTQAIGTVDELEVPMGAQGEGTVHVTEIPMGTQAAGIVVSSVIVSINEKNNRLKIVKNCVSL